MVVSACVATKGDRDKQIGASKFLLGKLKKKSRTWTKKSNERTAKCFSSRAVQRLPKQIELVADG